MSGSDGEATRAVRESAARSDSEDLAWRLREWFVVDGDRLLVAAGISAAVFVALLGLDEVGAIAFVNDDSITRLAGGMIAGTFSLVTLVVSINQLILSREFTSADEFRERLAGVVDFRRDVESAAEATVAPPEPARLFRVLLAAIDRRASALEAATADREDAELRRRVAEYVDDVTACTERVGGEMESSSFGTFHAVSAAIGYPDARQIYAARELRADHEDELSDDALDAFEDLLEALRLFDVAREHFKTTYLQLELTRFSQLTIYAGIPAVFAAVTLGLLYADYGGATLQDPYLPLVASALIAVIFLPLAVLGAFILRTAAVGRRTAPIGPMLLQASTEDRSPADPGDELDGGDGGRDAR